MTYEQYYQTMKEHGIGELLFLYNNKRCAVLMYMKGLNIYYTIYCGESVTYYDSLDAIIFSKCFDGKDLKGIWNEIELLEIDGVLPDEYDVYTCSFDYITYLKEQGELLWSYFLTKKRSFLIQLKYALLGVLLPLTLFMLFPILKLSNWNIMFLVGGCAVFALLVAAIAIWKNGVIFNYIITTKKIFVYNGLALDTTYDNIKKIKVRKSIFNKNVGTVKLYLKKGLSLNYRLEGISDCNKVYEMILENMRNK